MIEMSHQYVHIDKHTDQYLNVQSDRPLHQQLGLVKGLFHRADNPVCRPDDFVVRATTFTSMSQAMLL